MSTTLGGADTLKQWLTVWKHLAHPQPFHPRLSCLYLSCLISAHQPHLSSLTLVSYLSCFVSAPFASKSLLPPSLVSTSPALSALSPSPQLSQPLLSSLSLSSALSAFLQPRLYGIYLSSYLFSLVSTTLSSLVSQPLSSLVSQPLSPASSLSLSLQPCLYLSSHLSSLVSTLQPRLTTSPASTLSSLISSLVSPPLQPLY